MASSPSVSTTIRVIGVVMCFYRQRYGRIYNNCTCVELTLVHDRNSCKFSSNLFMDTGQGGTLHQSKYKCRNIVNMCYKQAKLIHSRHNIRTYEFDKNRYICMRKLRQEYKINLSFVTNLVFRRSCFLMISSLSYWLFAKHWLLFSSSLACLKTLVSLCKASLTEFNSVFRYSASVMTKIF